MGGRASTLNVHSLVGAHAQTRDQVLLDSMVVLYLSAHLAALDLFEELRAGLRSYDTSAVYLTLRVLLLVVLYVGLLDVHWLR